jgi:hypothetical protein
VHELRQPLLVSEAPDAFVMDDIRWGWEDIGEPRLVPTFRQVTIDPTRVAEVFWWSESFRPKWIAAHGQFAFVMDGPDAVRTEQGETDVGFVFSVQPFFREGERFEVLKGFGSESYPILHLVTSLRDRVQRASVIYKQEIDAYRLYLDPEQRVELARLCLRSSAKERPEARYHTTRRSCVTEAVRLLNKVLPEDQRIPLWVVPKVIHNPRLSLPRQTPGYLMELGLADHADSWDGSVRALRWPRPTGGDLVLDVLAMPGAKVPAGARALEDALFDYTCRARELREFQAEAPGRPGDPEHRQHLLAAAEAEERLHEALARVRDLTLADPPTTVPFLLGLERPDTPQAQLMVESLLRALQEEIAAGRWTPTEEQAEAIAHLSGSPGGATSEEEDRPFVPRQRQSRLVHEDEERMVIEEFRWAWEDQGEPRLTPTFTTATIFPERIAEVFWWSERFAPKWLAAHGQLAFVMDGAGGVQAEDGREADGFIYSVEGHFRKGQVYNPLRGLHPNSEYGIIHMLTTLRDRLQQAHVIYNHSMDVYRLLLNPEQKAELVRRALRRASTPRRQLRYHTTRRSCVTESMKLLNQVLPEEHQLPLWTVPGVLHNLRISLPQRTPEYLVEHGLAEYVRSWEEDVGEVRLPRGEGEPLRLHVAGLIGTRAPGPVRALESALHQYVTAAQALRTLEAQEGDEDGAALSTERAALEATLADALEAVVELAAADPAETVPYLLGLERPDTPQAATLARAVLTRLERVASKGKWEPTVRQRHAMDAIGALFDPGGS